MMMLLENESDNRNKMIERQMRRRRCGLTRMMNSTAQLDMFLAYRSEVIVFEYQKAQGTVG